MVLNGAALARDTCRLKSDDGRIKHVIYVQFDNTHFLRDNPNHKKDFGRLKGLGEMDAEELRVTTMEDGLRTLLQVNVEQAALADEVVSTLMGDVVEVRKAFIVNNAKDARFLDI